MFGVDIQSYCMSGSSLYALAEQQQAITLYLQGLTFWPERK
jgi:hypothetical protein